MGTPVLYFLTSSSVLVLQWCHRVFGGTLLEMVEGYWVRVGYDAWLEAAPASGGSHSWKQLDLSRLTALWTLMAHSSSSTSSQEPHPGTKDSQIRPVRPGRTSNSSFRGLINATAVKVLTGQKTSALTPLAFLILGGADGTMVFVQGGPLRSGPRGPATRAGTLISRRIPLISPECKIKARVRKEGAFATVGTPPTTGSVSSVHRTTD